MECAQNLLQVGGQGGGLARLQGGPGGEEIRQKEKICSSFIKQRERVPDWDFFFCEFQKCIFFYSF